MKRSLASGPTDSERYTEGVTREAVDMGKQVSPCGRRFSGFSGARGSLPTYSCGWMQALPDPDCPPADMGREFLQLFPSRICSMVISNLNTRRSFYLLSFAVRIIVLRHWRSQV